MAPARIPVIREDATEETFLALIRTTGLLHRVMSPYFARFGVSGAHWGVLITLHRATELGMPRLRLTDLSARLLIRPPSVTGVVDRLQGMGLVRRDPSTVDQRSKTVGLTPRGQGLVRRILKGHRRQVAKVMLGLRAPEQRRLRGLLGRLGAHLEALACQGGFVPIEMKLNGPIERTQEST
jgi:DNA-binding MarR family transcriptional regulator